ncbi:MAG: GGDEF domain-containing protein [Bdellovibrionales bacterium]|nr:GGDEF domain-containing protein [Bdellovibrionales bacterium]
MKHEDFTSLALDDVLTKVMGYCQAQTKCTAVHWISAYGLMRVHEASEANWQHAFAAADVIGQHMWSQPASDSFSVFQLWRQVNDLFPQPWRKKMPAHMLTQPAPRFVYPVFFEEKFLGVVVLDKPKEVNPVQLTSQFKPGMDLASKYLHFAYQHLNARNETYLDELTGLYNQRYLPIVLEHEINRAKRDGVPFTLLFLDIDYFKMVNDGRGHWVGSRLLVELGKVLKGQVRGCDYCFRYGGDEFIVLLGSANPEDSQKVAERIRKAVEQKTFTVEGHNLNLTVSIGLASYPQHAQTAPGLIQIADQAMYYGKRKSRNIVFVAS